MCKYCEDGVAVVSDDDVCFIIMADSNGKSYLRRYDKSNDFIINFCPMCGKKINNESELNNNNTLYNYNICLSFVEKNQWEKIEPSKVNIPTKNDSDIEVFVKETNVMIISQDEELVCFGNYNREINDIRIVKVFNLRTEKFSLETIQ